MIQLVSPIIPNDVWFGECLKQIRSSFKAPIRGASATSEADATQFRNTSRTMPNAMVPVWFDHWGTYQNLYANWGHVVLWVPGRGFMSSPGKGFGTTWYKSIEEIERLIGKYRFWSEDINGVRVVEPTSGPNTPTTNTSLPEEEEEDSMKAICYVKGKRYFVAIIDPRSGLFTEYNTTDEKYNSRIASTLTGNFALVTEDHYKVIKQDFANLRKGK